MNIKQIAKKAGVSVATVSRVLNHPESVAEATREKIQKVMDEEEYRPNWFARGLNFDRTKTLGVLIPHTLGSYYLDIANGIEEVVRQKGYITFLCNVEKDPQIEREYVNQLITRRVDGIILMFSALDEKSMRLIEENDIPAVLIGENRIKSDWSSVMINGRSASADMTRHLFECGHKNIGLLCGRDPEQESEEILRGYKDVMDEMGVSIDTRLISHVENSIEGGYIGMKQMISEVKPHAIFATSDEIAYGAMEAAKDMGMTIPGDVAVAGFGNSRMSNLVEPKLTTVDQPYRKMGIYGARILFDMIEDEELEPQHITLQGKLRIRKSCGHTDRIGEMF
ncbi:MAG: LacI family DNA-binding transcriptional regulator [Firmicutes bacterium]|nr:LacI family DNA-binding transcriptional regulator [Bacillota bacterium]